MIMHNLSSLIISRRKNQQIQYKLFEQIFTNMMMKAMPTVSKRKRQKFVWSINNWLLI
jgi:hypothetical protein